MSELAPKANNEVRLIELVKRFNERFDRDVGYGFEVSRAAIPFLEQSLKEGNTKPFDRWYDTLKIGERIY